MAKGDTTIAKVFTCKPGWGGHKKAFFTCTFDNYKTGGYNFDLTGYGLGTILQFNVPACKSGIIFAVDEANKKLLCYYADYDAVADGALIEVADNAATLNAAVIKFSVEGVGV